MDLKKDNLSVEIYPDRIIMGEAAAKAVIGRITKLLTEKEEISMIFAAAPSQSDFLSILIADETVEWNRINAFHLDEYIGLEEDAPQLFCRFLEKSIFGKVSFKEVYYINGQATDYQEECKRYTDLLSIHKIDIACIGIGENGHIAFNDPHVADFDDPYVMKVVDLDLACRMQQVNDKCFDDLESVPRLAYTLTIPALMSADYIYCIVPGSAKAMAVYHTLYGMVSEKCPASVLRRKKNAILYLDSKSSSMLEVKMPIP